MQDRRSPVKWHRLVRCYDGINDALHAKELIVTSATRSGRLNVDLQEFRQVWLDHCRANGTTPSKAFRAVVAKLLNVSDKSAPEGDLDGRGKLRKEIRLTAQECSAAEAMAAREGFNLSRWIVALIRSRLAGGPQLGQQELELLARSNMQMLALGRTLNQLAKAAHAEPGVLRSFQIAQIEQTAALVREHVTCVSSVLQSNTARWGSI